MAPALYMDGPSEIDRPVNRWPASMMFVFCFNHFGTLHTMAGVLTLHRFMITELNVRRSWISLTLVGTGAQCAVSRALKVEFLAEI